VATGVATGAAAAGGGGAAWCVATVRLAAVLVAAGRDVDATLCRTVVRLVVVALVLADVSGVAVEMSGTATVGVASVAGALSVAGAVEGAVCVVSGVACCASRGVEESAKAAAIAVAPSRAWSLCLVIVSHEPPFRMCGASVIGGSIGNAAQVTAVLLTMRGSRLPALRSESAALTAGRMA